MLSNRPSSSFVTYVLFSDVFEYNANSCATSCVSSVCASSSRTFCQRPLGKQLVLMLGESPCRTTDDKHTVAHTRVRTNTDILRESVLSLAAAKSLSQETLHPLLSRDASHMTFKGGRSGLEGGWHRRERRCAVHLRDSFNVCVFCFFDGTIVLS